MDENSQLQRQRTDYIKSISKLCIGHVTGGDRKKNRELAEKQYLTRALDTALDTSLRKM